jgi:hypothetical protein
MKRWPADEAVKEQERVANGTALLLSLIGLMQYVFNTTLEQTLYAVWPNPFLNSTPAMTNVPDLLLVDGSEPEVRWDYQREGDRDREVIPLQVYRVRRAKDFKLA